ncbi:MAG TPA: TraR/DksA C4-type zinc finger protein [Ktedonobacteraceae bacterium]|jgi:RNA polymerase-binding protein DksA
MKLDLQKQKSRLLEKKAELESSIAALTEAYPTPVSSTEAHEGPRDIEDVATDFLETQQEQSIMVNQKALLTLVENALQRLENGTYGLCQQCGEAINPKRLEALPWAERCVRCEKQLEQVYQEREDVYGAPQTF